MRSRPRLGLVSLALSLLCTLWPNPSRSERLQFGSFQIDWPDGYVRQADHDLIRYRGPKGLTLTVTVWDRVASGQVNGLEVWRRYAEHELVAAAARHGQIVIPLKETRLSSGLVLFSVAEEAKGLLSKSFGLLFLVVPNDGRVAQIAVEGPGTASEEIGAFLPLMETARFAESPGPIPVPR